MRVSMGALGVTAPEAAAVLMAPVNPAGLLALVNSSTPNCNDVTGGVCLAPPRAGVDPSVSQQACVAAKGQWNGSDCVLNIGPDLPTYCGYIPYAAALFSECQLPNATDFANYGNYTAYETGQLANAAFTNPAGGPTGATGSGLDVEAQMETQDQAAGAAAEAAMDCGYLASQNSPTLAQILGPSVAAMLTNPFSQGCTSTSNIPGWAIYAGLGLLGLLLWSRR